MLKLVVVLYRKAASPEGKRSTADLEAFADLGRSTWSIVDERVRRR